MAHFMKTLGALLAADEPADPLKAARWRWLHETTRKWLEAERRVEAAWAAVFAFIPDHVTVEEIEAMNLPDPPEQAEEDALWAQLNDVVQKDKWPREMYWGGL